MESLERAHSEYEAMQRLFILSRYTIPETPSPSDSIYRTYVHDPSKPNGRRQLSSSTREGLKDKVYAWERSNKSSNKYFKTVYDAFTITQNEKLKYVKSEEKRCSVENTVSRNNINYKRFIADTDFHNKYICEITKNDIEDILFLNLSRYDLNYKGFQSLKSVLKPIFDLAFQEEWIEDNPYSRINFKKFSNMIVDDVPIEKRVHSSEDINRMLDYIHSQQKKYPKSISGFALELQILIALRRGEIPALMWEDLSSDCLTIRREMLELKKASGTSNSKYAIVQHTKTYKDRKYPMTNDLRAFLERLKAFHRVNGWDSQYLFPVANEYGCITTKSIYSFYHRMCKNLGIATSKDFIKGTHAFRRTRITEVTNKSGGNIVMASQLFGNSPEIAKKHYYTGLDLEEARRVLNG